MSDTAVLNQAEALPSYLYRSEAFAEDLTPSEAGYRQPGWASALGVMLPLTVAVSAAVALAGMASVIAA